MEAIVNTTVAKPFVSLPLEAIDACDPANDARAFRRCLGQYGTGVGVITALHEGQWVGMAVNSFVAAPARPAASVEEISFMRLLTGASARMSTLFQAHREALGITPPGARLLSRLLAGACELEELERATFLGRLTIDDALADLETQGLLRRGDAGRPELTPQGRAKSEALAQRAAAFTTSVLAGLADADIEAARRVLAELMGR